ncbi:hypothetical protein J2793_006775 [Paraburkholderia caledonica]|uniref:Uncharacterized protein n=1 Tax=Paraburkholderia caledonica TaxID=134536 RepID=A0AB73IMS8_9BURK|nr:hypothetical protein [Paraburkholderia caledonica]
MSCGNDSSNASIMVTLQKTRDASPVLFAPEAPPGRRLQSLSK